MAWSLILCREAVFGIEVPSKIKEGVIHQTFIVDRGAGLVFISARAGGMEGRGREGEETKETEKGEREEDD